ncbi:hypothetical protein, partial [Streptomyces sp. NPDC055105]|uniref:hypothetical protein n=1 Tax=Streptomyces sp. NPDC055105 TaxID=3365719 RepID=UPI0037D40E06
MSKPPLPAEAQQLLRRRAAAAGADRGPVRGAPDGARCCCHIAGVGRTTVRGTDSSGPRARAAGAAATSGSVTTEPANAGT